VWIIEIGMIVAFIATCETVLVFARRNPQLVAKLYLLGDLVKTAEPDSAKPRDENEPR
jgi:hypothetical protein